MYTVDELAEGSANKNTVPESARPILDTAFTLYLDNWYSSSKLYIELRERPNALATRSNKNFSQI
jgi:hypothetical protein